MDPRHVYLEELLRLYTSPRGAQRSYPKTGCNGTPSLSNMIGFYVNVTETFSDSARVCAMVIDERYSTVPST